MIKTDFFFVTNIAASDNKKTSYSMWARVHLSRRRTTEQTIPDVSQIYLCLRVMCTLEIFSKSCYLVRSLICESVNGSFVLKYIALRNLYFLNYLKKYMKEILQKRFSEFLSCAHLEICLCANWV